METKWYDKKWMLWAALIICWPLGLYLLYRQRRNYTKTQIILYIIITAHHHGHLVRLRPAQCITGMTHRRSYGKTKSFTDRF